MIEVHNATDTTYPSFSVTTHKLPGRDCLALEGSFGEIMSALCTALMNASAMSAHDRADIKRAMHSARMHNIGTRTSEMYFTDVTFSVDDMREHEHASACGVCDGCLFGKQCELICHS
jgi:hypothetical protein